MKKVLLFFALLFAGFQIAAAQSMQVSGKVTYADDGSPVIGATIKVQGSTQVATLSDVNGMYKITVPASATSKVLVASFAGLKDAQADVTSNNQTINFSLETDAQQIDNVQVVGYGSARKVGTIVGSVQQVTAAKIEARPTAGVMDALQGQVAGLQIFTSNGEPSATSSVQLHGVGSLTAGSTPLYVLDGVAIDADRIKSMNSNDFESVTVLKDASATSIYGSRAANGVIYITTKRGKLNEKASVTVRGSYGFSNIANRKFYDELMSGDQLKSFWLENEYVDDAYIQELNDEGFTHNTKWLDYYQRKNVPIYTADFSVAGGGGKTTYYVSGSMYHQDGTAPSSSFDRFTVTSNVESQALSWLKIGANIQLNKDKQEQNLGYGTNDTNGGLSFLAPGFYSPYKEDGSKYYDELIPGWGRYSPYYRADKMPRTTDTWGTNSSAFIQLEPIKDLKITSRGGISLNMDTYTAKNYPSYKGALNNGQLGITHNNDITSTITNTIEYKFKLAPEHTLTALVGQEGVSYNYERSFASTKGLTDDRLMNLNNGKKDTYDVESGQVKYGFLSYFGRLDYAFSDRVFADVSVRNDASSRFGSNNRNATFWAVGAMWNLKNEDFLKDSKVVTALTFRASYGTQGNSDFGQGGATRFESEYLNNYAALATVGPSNKYNQMDGWIVSNAGNPDLTWETQHKLTIGANISLWNMLHVGVEFYNRETKDMLMDVPVPLTTGFGSVLQNVGALNNTGVDLNISIDILKGKDYYLGFSTVFNYNKMKIKSLFDGKTEWVIPGTSLGYIVGQPLMFYMPIYAGVNTETGEQQWYLPGDDPNKTQMDPNKVTSKFDENALNQNTGKNRYAPFSGGFSLNGSWKGIGLQADFSYVIGKDMMVNERYFSENPAGFFGMNTSTNVLDSWKKPGDIAAYPNWADQPVMQFDTHLMSDASFLRLKNLTLSYTLPSHILAKSRSLTGIKVYATARNLVTVTSYNGVDPEVNSNLSMAPLGNSKQFIFGLELKF